MSHEDQNVNPREYGELISTVKHLSGAVEGLQKQHAEESGKLHTRLDELMRSMVPRHEHDRLAEDVRQVWDHAYRTREMLTTSSTGLAANQRWLDRLMFTALGLVVAACGVAAKMVFA